MKLMLALAAAGLAAVTLMPSEIETAIGRLGLTGASEPGSGTAYVTDTVRLERLRQSVVATGVLKAVATVEVSSQLSGQIDALTADFNDRVSRGQTLAALDRRGFEARVTQAMAELRMAEERLGILQARLERAVEAEAEAVIGRRVFAARVAQAGILREAAGRRRDRTATLAGRGTAAGAAVDDAESEFRSADAALDEARALAAAHERVIASGGAARREAEAELANARAELPLREAALRLAELDLERSVIRSPIDGIVIGRNVELGQTVAATLDAPVLFTIAGDLSRLEIQADVDETDIGLIAVGQRASFTVDAFPGERFPARVREIRKAARRIQSVVSYAVMLEAANPSGTLLPGMTSTIRVIVEETEPVLTVPLAALGYRAAGSSGEPSVWVLDPTGGPRRVAVRATLDDGRRVAVSSAALAEGATVILGEGVPADRGFWESLL